MDEQSAEKIEQPSYDWMPVAGGILNIASGLIGLIATAFLVAFSVTLGASIAREVLSSLGFLQIGIPITIIWLFAIPMLIISVVSIIGGVYAVNKRNWGLALAGAMCSIVPSQVIGVIAVIFIVISKKEFK
ncbi:MAG: hypothetical protein PHE15_04120 [Dehalococcoidales bacterium]|nr:hypothetical protein [Dehalococcoidales bacterium]